MRRYRAYGLEIDCERELPLRPSASRSEPDVLFIHSGVAPPNPPSGRDRRALSRNDRGWLLRYDNEEGGWMAFDHSAESRSVHVSGSVDWETCVGPLSGLVCGVLLRIAGATLLHGACGSIGGKAIALLGASGSGKSTLAAGLIARGATLIAEDLLAIRRDAGEYLVEPGAPTLHLLEDSHDRLGPGLAPFALAIHDREDGKIRLDLAPGDEESLAPVRLSALFLLESGAAPDGPSLRRLSGPEAVRGLMDNLYGASWIRPADEADLEYCARLAGQIPVFALSRPWDLEGVSETAAALQDIAARLE
jgi:hypothetical protein